MTSFYPAVSTRSSSQLGISRLLFQINNDQTAIQNLQTQLSTGRRITNPSQDPAAAIRALTAQRQLEFKSQVDDNLASADTILSATESTLSQAQSILNEMRGVAVQAAGNINSPEEEDAFVAQLQAAISELTDLANSKFRDQFIFGGSDILANPFQFAGDAVQFNGNAEELQTISDFATTVAANVTAQDAFGVQSSEIVSNVDLNAAVAGDTPLSNLNRGAGVRGGAISFSNGADFVELDLANSYDLNDVLTRINATVVGGRPLSASLTADGLTVDFLDGLGGTLRIDEVGSGSTAAGLGIRNVGATGVSPVVGTDLNPITTYETPLSQLFGGAGITIGDSFQIVQGNKTFTVKTDGLETVEDLVNRIQGSGALVRASLDSSGRFLAIQSTESGTSLSIGEDGSDLASTLGIRTFDATTSLSKLNFGQGILSTEASDALVLVRSDSTRLTIDLEGAQNVQDVIDRINNNVDNFTAGLRIVASLSTSGNGLVLTAAAGAEQIRVENAGGSQAAWGLGLVPRDTTFAEGETVGTNSVIGGYDVSGIEVDGAFNTLIRMRQAIENGKPEELIRLTASLDEDIQRLSLSRGLVGTRQQTISRSVDLSAEQQLLLKQIESDELDTDFAQVVSELSAREAALQASLQLMGQTSRLTLFDYI